ncbi:hypothetical protein, partial [Methyloglobulus morosus]|uniref:hypothetical protein n=1 Tax=Methyloglobulus morosus TaxID=1410681 RepID=UPI00056A3B0C
IENDNIAIIGIDESKRLYVTPMREEFPYIYRAAMQVNWDDNGKCLYSPVPSEWTYLQWFQQIIAAANSEYGVSLAISHGTQWESIDNDLKHQILTAMGYKT